MEDSTRFLPLCPKASAHKRLHSNEEWLHTQCMLKPTDRLKEALSSSLSSYRSFFVIISYRRMTVMSPSHLLYHEEILAGWETSKLGPIHRPVIIVCEGRFQHLLLPSSFLSFLQWYLWFGISVTLSVSSFWLSEEYITVFSVSM